MAEGLREAPVDNQGFAILADDDVPRLDVAVEHSACVRVFEGVADVGEAAEEFAEFQRVAGGVGPQPGVDVKRSDGVLERVASDEPHRVIGAAVGVDTEPVHRHDPGVLEPAGDLGLDEKPVAAGRVVGVAIEDLLEGDLAVQLAIERHEHFPQTTPGVRAEHAEPLTVGRRCPNRERGCAVSVGFG
jgi:hypothetical protein